MGVKINVMLKKLGNRLKVARLNADLTQQDVANLIGKSRTAIDRAEKGRCNLHTFVHILIALNIEDQLEQFLPEQAPSPVLLAKAVGSKRQRASKAKSSETSNEDKTDAKDNLSW